MTMFVVNGPASRREHQQVLRLPLPSGKCRGDTILPTSNACIQRGIVFLGLCVVQGERIRFRLHLQATRVRPHHNLKHIRHRLHLSNEEASGCLRSHGKRAETFLPIAFVMMFRLILFDYCPLLLPTSSAIWITSHFWRSVIISPCFDRQCTIAPPVLPWNMCLQRGTGQMRVKMTAMTREELLLHGRLLC